METIISALNWMKTFILENAIALSALIVSIGSLIIQRKHNQLSVRPEIGGKTYASETELTVYQINVGLGPAKITYYKLLLDEKEIDLKTMDWVKFFREQNIFCDSIFVEITPTPSVLQVNEKWTIFTLEAHAPHKYSEEDQKNFFRIITRMNLIVHFESMYKKRFKFEIGFFKS
jgi:hypothetical protein